MSKPRNAMQAVLDRAAQGNVAEASQPSGAPAPVAPGAPSGSQAAMEKSYDRPSCRNTRLIGGHFRPEVARQLRMLAAEEDTTIQALLAEAIDLLLTKKAKNRIGTGRLCCVNGGRPESGSLRSAD
jgi:hypothetical protein